MISSNPTILYIEDNQDNRKLVNRVLSAAGFNVIGVEDGIAGFEYLQTHQPDLILMDINLPHIDGYTITMRLRESDIGDSIPIIALTANVMQEDRQRCLEVGCNGIIQKPIDIDTLPHEILRYIVQS